MALSNLIWWPWFGIGGQAPPAPGYPHDWLPGGDITPPQTRPPTEAVWYRVQEDEDEFILYLLDKL